MSTVRRLVLSSLATCVMALIGASAASAQGTPIEVLNEGSGTEVCNPCSIHLVGESSIFAQPSGIEVSKCQDELEGVINPDGTGEVGWIPTTHDPVGPGCNVVNCIDQDEQHWPLINPVEVEGNARMTLRVCYRALSGVAEIHCDLVVTIPQTQTHDQQLTANRLCASNTRQVQANWQTETDAHNTLEVIHGGATPIEVRREVPDSEPCGPCDIHLTGETAIFAQPSGVEVSKCQDELEGTINHGGTGELTWNGTTHDPPGPGCNVIDCTATGEEHWPLTFPVEVAGDARVTLRACYRGATGGSEIHCDLVVTIPQTPTHNPQLTTDELCASNVRQVQADWQTESTTHDSLEIVHSDP